MKDRTDEGLTPATDAGRRLIENARDAAERTGVRAQASVSRLSDRVQDVAGELVEDARDKVARFTGRDLDAWTSDVRHFVRERPLQAVLATVAIGYVLGKILKRG